MKKWRSKKRFDGKYAKTGKDLIIEVDYLGRRKGVNETNLPSGRRSATRVS